MTLDELKQELRDIRQTQLERDTISWEERHKNGDYDDWENDHMAADNMLLMYIDDPEVERLFEEIDKWYA